MTIKNRPQLLLTVSIGTALIAILLFPYAINGMWFDDALNSQTWGMLHRFHSGVLDFSMRVTKAWLYSSGRIMLAWLPIYEFNDLLRHARLIRLTDILFVLAHVGCVVYLLRQMKISWPTLGMFILILFTLFQIRDSNDPIAAYAAFSQSLGIAITLALILLLKWFRTGFSRYLIASSAIATLSLLFYEINIIYAPIAVASVFAATHTRRVKSLLIIIIPVAIFISVDLYIRHHAASIYSGSSLGSLDLIPVTYAKEIGATLPGSFYMFRGRFSYPVSKLFLDFEASRVAWIALGLASILYIRLARQQHREFSRIGNGVVLISAAFIILPAALIAISAKYQVELAWGQSHLPVYYQYFGLALLLALASENLSHSKAFPAQILIGLLFSVYVASNWLINMHEVDVLNQVFSEPRNSLVSALKSGLFDKVQDGDIVEIDNQPIFINGNLIYQTIEKNVSIPNEAAIAGWFVSKPRPSAKRYRLFRDKTAGDAWRLRPVTP